MNKITTKLIALLLVVTNGAVQAMPTVNFVSQSGTANSNIPVTFGQVFAVGDVPAGNSVNLVAGTTSLPTQVDIKATHPDGSLRHAVISTKLPALNAGENLATNLVMTSQNSNGTALNLTDLLASNFAGEVTLEVAGTDYTANIRDLLQGIGAGGAGADVIFKNSFDYNSSLQVWLSGSEAAEWIVSAPFKTAGGAEHPHLTARFNVRAYAGFDSVRVDVIVENNWSYVPEPQNLVYDVSVSLCGNSVYNKTDLTHYNHARWRKTFWCGNEPAVHIKHDIDYLIDSYAVPNYDRSLVIPENKLADMEASWTGDKIEPMGLGAAGACMSCGGASPGIGPLPLWASAYLLSQDVRAKNITLGTGDLAGTWRVHYRDKDTDLPISLDDYPYITLRGSYGGTWNPNTGEHEAFPECGGDCSAPFLADTAHQPSFSYIPYLITGDYYHLEELHFWANYNMFNENSGSRGYAQGLFNRTAARSQGWSLRTLAQTAYITPNTHPLKSYFQQRVQYNLDWYNDAYINNPPSNPHGFLTNGGTLAYNGGRGLAPWQDDFFTWSIGYLVELGFTDAVAMHEWKAQFPVNRMTNTSFCWLFATLYSLNVRDDNTSPIYPTWAEIYNAVDPTLSTFVCNSQEMADYRDEGIGEMIGYPSSPTGYPANLQPALAVSAKATIPNGLNAWNIFDNRSMKPDYSSFPNFAIVPR